MQGKVVVVGSLNMDLIVRAPRLPRGGETLTGHDFSTAAGGKGANQAVAAARLGAQVAMVGCVGADAYGARLRTGLISEGIDCKAVSEIDGVPTGIASILVDDAGQNAIVIVAGGNGALTPQHLSAQAQLLADAQVLIVQLEVPDATVEAAMKLGREAGCTVILNPAPVAGPLPAHWYGMADYLIPNESEAAALTGLPVGSPQSALPAARSLLQAGARRVLITLGAQGVLYADAERHAHFAVAPVAAVDTTAAGDTFVGGFAAALAAGQPLEAAIALGQQAAALAVTRPGAQPSIPYRHELPA
ncbi:ribokinase [Pseudomonas straminea]|uniref:Ribokinase n=1 Tax=Pseudomonas straminea TaxID=47882 RepID=A0A1I1UNY9_PSEOC|nr:ribokinase [Pseudomonas straminea]GLX14126.1 ribokinase [Pseudomonas straminea]SFD69700.1 ribokinase [Pseudomonas straminea]